MEVSPKVHPPFDVATAFKDGTIYAASPASSDDAEDFFRFISSKFGSQQELVITIVFQKQAINYNTYVQMRSFYTKEWCPFGYISTGFSVGYSGSGPTSLANALTAITGQALPTEISSVVFGKIKNFEDGTITFHLSKEQ